MTILLKRRPANPDLDLPDSMHPLLRRIYSQRAVATAEELQLGLNNLLPPDQFKGMAAAIDLLQEALSQQQKIVIVADFDADGATSCVVAMKALQQFGYQQVDYIVPNRFEYGYGLTPEIVELAKTKQPDLIITVDNGISSIEGVAAANSAGIKILITDHHLPGATTPDADPIVNPNKHCCE
ncbi:MAG: DHH family phosphoesterase, partial [Proteobacteria bacterium]|nr:DHH family phosphoesterase [Pseudomonadota bacterium]